MNLNKLKCFFHFLKYEFGKYILFLKLSIVRILFVIKILLFLFLFLLYVLKVEK